jgi:hypothetical protein
VPCGNAASRLATSSSRRSGSGGARPVASAALSVVTAPDLQREERVAAGHGVHPPQRRKREDDAQAIVQHPVCVVDGERPDGEPLEGLELREAVRQRLAGPSRQHETDPRSGHAPPGKRQHLRRGLVRPLGIVHRKQHGTRGLQRSQRGDRGDAEQAGIQRRARRLEQERDAERLGLRSREDVEDVVERVAEQVAEAGERKLRLGRGGAGGENAPIALTRRVKRGAPERRLADTRVALEHERRRAGLDLLHERRERGQLGRSSDDADRRCPHVPPTLGRSARAVQRHAVRARLRPSDDASDA